MYTVKHYHPEHIGDEAYLLWMEVYPAIDSAEEIAPDTMRYNVAFFDRDGQDGWYRLDTPEVYMPAVPSLIQLDCLAGFICELIEVEECIERITLNQRPQEDDDILSQMDYHDFDH